MIAIAIAMFAIAIIRKRRRMETGGWRAWAHPKGSPPGSCYQRRAWYWASDLPTRAVPAAGGPSWSGTLSEQTINQPQNAMTAEPNQEAKPKEPEDWQNLV